MKKNSLLKKSGVEAYFIIYLISFLFSLYGCATISKADIPTNVEIQKSLPPIVTPESGEVLKSCGHIKPLDSGVCSVIPGSNYLLITGNVLTSDEVLVGGSVYVNPQGIIENVSCDIPENVKKDNPTIINCPSGVISPGLINAHDHITWDQNYPAKWGTKRYNHRNEWRSNGHPDMPYNPGKEDQFPWSELRQVLSGTTSIAGSGGTPGFLRNLDRKDLLEGLNADAAYYNVFPLGDSKEPIMLPSGCNYPKIDDPSNVLTTQCYIPHVAEGINQAANNEIHCMDVNKLVTSKSNFIHAMGALAKDGYLLSAKGTSIIWSPRSNISLYGNTAIVTMYKNLGINIALGTDWTPSGSMNLLRELKCADFFNKNYLRSFFSDKDLWKMVTANAADGLQLSNQIGRLKNGLIADIAIYDGSISSNPYRAIIDANVENVALVLRGGIPLYGDSNIMKSIPRGQDGCEDFPGGINGKPKIVCAKRETGIDFDTLQKNNINSYPLFFNGTPIDEPTCIPSRVGEYTGERTPDDFDGDGIPNEKDNCPYVFNPIRPLDNGIQADCNNNGIGDACDPKPCE